MCVVQTEDSSSISNSGRAAERRLSALLTGTFNITLLNVCHLHLCVSQSAQVQPVLVDVWTTASLCRARMCLWLSLVMRSQQWSQLAQCALYRYKEEDCY
jgi:thioredoxin-like negative regulator of GroEL